MEEISSHQQNPEEKSKSPDWPENLGLRYACGEVSILQVEEIKFDNDDEIRRFLEAITIPTKRGRFIVELKRNGELFYRIKNIFGEDAIKQAEISYLGTDIKTHQSILRAKLLRGPTGIDKNQRIVGHIRIEPFFLDEKDELVNEDEASR